MRAASHAAQLRPRQSARRQSEENELASWLAGQPDVVAAFIVETIRDHFPSTPGRRSQSGQVRRMSWALALGWIRSIRWWSGALVRGRVSGCRFGPRSGGLPEGVCSWASAEGVSAGVGDQPDPAVPAAPEVHARDRLPDFEVAERLVPVLRSGERTQRADTGLTGRAALLHWNVGGGVVQVDGRSGTLRPGVHAGGVAGGQGIADCLRDLVAVDGWRIGQHYRLEGDGMRGPSQSQTRVR
jgi:hypothetical protein